MIVYNQNDVIDFRVGHYIINLLSGHVKKMCPLHCIFPSREPSLILEDLVKIFPLILVCKLFLFCLRDGRDYFWH